ncbi:MAG: T9SS type A sorting domain-containing protein [Saprospiraceae bacterium]
MSKITKKTRIYNFWSHATAEGYLESDFFFEFDSVVYLYLHHKNEFDTLYNLGVAVGTSWTTQRYVDSGIIKTTILNKGEQNINGEILHWLLLEYKYELGFPQTIQDTVYERVGNTKIYYYPWDYFERQLDGGQGGYLRCYEDNKIGHLRFSPEDIPCDFVTAANNNIFYNFIQISPNPFTDFININFSEPITSNFYVIIHSIEGRIIKRLKLTENTEAFEIPTAELPPGYYLLTLTEQGVIKFATKIIKI